MLKKLSEVDKEIHKFWTQNEELTTKKLTFESSLNKTRQELDEIWTSKQKEIDLINELKEWELKKLRKEVKEFEKEVEIKKGERESTKD